MLFQIEGVNRIWNTDFVMDITLKESEIILMSSMGDEFVFKCSDPIHAKSLLRRILSGTGGHLFAGDNCTCDLSSDWDNASKYKLNEKPKKDNDNENPFD